MARMEALMQAVLRDRAACLPADESTTRSVLHALNPSSVCFGSRMLAFPSPADYQRYCALFFADLHLLYPCIDETAFRTASSHMLAAPSISSTDACLLALHYILFACVDLLHVHVPTLSGPIEDLPGWPWFHLADELVGKRPQYGCSDMNLVQFLLFQALYFTFAEQPSLAYSTIGMASRLALQHGLHRQSSYTSLTPTETRQQLAIFWDVYIADRRISLSCRRPYSIRESDIDVSIEQPAVLQRHDADSAFTACMVHWAHLAGYAWDHFSAATASHRTSDDAGVASLDAHMTQKTTTTLSKLTSRLGSTPRINHVFTALNDLHLFAARPAMLSFECTPETARICAITASDTIRRTIETSLASPSLSPSTSTSTPPTPSFKRHEASSLGNALLTLCALLVRSARHPSHTPLTHPPAAAAENPLPTLHRALTTLRTMAPTVPLAQRLLDDFSPLTSMLAQVIDDDDDDDVAQAFAGGAAMPRNVLELFPYRDLGLGVGTWDGGVGWSGGARVLWV